MKIKYLVLATLLSTTAVNADDSTLDAAIGGGLGGAVGAAIGNEVGGRDGAIIGGALGGSVGAAVATEDGSGNRDSHSKYRNGRAHYEQSTSRFCPPGQAKKGRC